MCRSRIVSVCLAGVWQELVRVGREGDDEKMERKKRLCLVYVQAVSGFSPPKALSGKVRQCALCTGYLVPPSRCRDESGYSDSLIWILLHRSLD